MSEFIVFRCQKCQHQVPLGFLGSPYQTSVICNGCESHFTVVAQANQPLWQSNQPCLLLTIGKEDFISYSKKGRVKAKRSRKALVKTGQEIPLHEEVLQIGDDLYIQYSLDLRATICPSCQSIGQLKNHLDYVKSCPRCQHAPMSEESM